MNEMWGNRCWFSWDASHSFGGPDELKKYIDEWASTHATQR